MVQEALWINAVVALGAVRLELLKSRLSEPFALRRFLVARTILLLLYLLFLFLLLICHTHREGMAYGIA